MLFHCGCQPRRVLILVGSATSAGASPGRRATTSMAIGRPVTFSQAEITWRTDWPLPVPMLNTSAVVGVVAWIASRCALARSSVCT